jgi:hypothetical protein
MYYHLGVIFFMNTKLLEHGFPIIQRIKEAASQEKLVLARSIIENTPPPAEWIVELPSKSNKNETYKTIPLDIMEGAMKTIFEEAYISSISSPTITQDKSGKYAVTVVVEYYYKPFDGFISSLVGVATVVCPDITMLELATPKASSMAVKNAIKQMGDFFGKSLNRPEDEVEIPVEKEEDQQATPEQLAQQLAACTTIEELKSYRLVIYAKNSPTELQELYETRLRSLKTKKQ